MFELMTAGEHTWYMSAPTNVGFYLHAPGKVCMIDVGDQTCAERALEHIRARGWELTALYLTHSHTDHVSGAAWLRNQTSCRVYAPGISAGGSEAQLPCGDNALRRKTLPGDVQQAAPAAALRVLGAFPGGHAGGAGISAPGRSRHGAGGIPNQGRSVVHGRRGNKRLCPGKASHFLCVRHRTAPALPGGAFWI